MQIVVSRRCPCLGCQMSLYRVCGEECLFPTDTHTSAEKEREPAHWDPSKPPETERLDGQEYVLQQVYIHAYDFFSSYLGVTLDGLMKNLQKTNALSKWQSFGVMLEIELSYLDAIAAKYHQEPENCLMRVLKLWLNRIDPPPSWSMLEHVLQFLGEEKLAFELKEKHSLQ